MKKLFAIILFIGLGYLGYSQCSGTTTLTAGSGTFDDGSVTGNYLNYQNCSWLIQPSNGGVITMNFTYFRTESSSDYVRVYDGPSTASALIGTYSGSTIPAQITSTGSSLYVVFYTDGSVVYDGFEIRYESCNFPKPTIASGGTSYCNSDILLATVLDQGYNYQWYKDGQLVPNQTSSTYFASSAGQYHVSKSDGNCVANSNNVNITSTLPAYLISATSGSICDGGFKRLSTYNSSYYTYQWYLDGAAISGATSYFYDAVVGGQYTVRYTSISAGCSRLTPSVMVDVLSTPAKPTVTVSGNLELCSSKIPPILTTNATNYTWNTGEKTSSILGSSAGIYFVTSTNGICSITSDTVVVTNGAPNSNITSEYSEICSGALLQVNGAIPATISDDFSTVNSAIWKTNTGTYTSGCQSSGRLFFEGSSTYRELVSYPLDLSSGGLVSFNLETGKCEPIAYDEEVMLQISTNGGTTWTTLVTYLYTAHSTAKDETYVIAPNQSYSNAMIRWRQETHDGTDTDTWSLDNVSIVSNNASTKNLTYSWSPANKFVNSTLQSTFVTIDTTMTLSLTVSDPSNGCSSTSTEVITVNNNYLGLSVYPATLSVCEGFTFDFFADLTYPGRNVTYSWASNGEIINTRQSSAYGELFTSQDVICTVIDTVTGCSSSAISQVQVNSYPSKPIITSAGSLCVDGDVVLTADRDVFWSTGTTAKTISVKQAGTYFASASINSCTTVSDSIVLNDNSPVASISKSNTAICAGGVLELSANTSSLSTVSDDFSVPNSGLWFRNTGTYTSGCQSSGRLFFEGSSTYRELVSNAIDLSSGGEIRFNLEVSRCEPIASDEEIVLQISTNGGSIWVNLITYNYLVHVTPKDEVYTIPANPAYANAMIRWYQESHDGTNTDTWSLDNVVIKNNVRSSSNSQYSYSWSPANMVEDATSSTTFTKPINSSTVIYLDVVDDSTGCSSRVSEILSVSTNGTVQGNPQIIASSDVVCSGGKVELSVLAQGFGSGSFKEDFTTSTSSNWSINTGSATTYCSGIGSGARYFYHTGTRQLVSNPLDLSKGGQVKFDMRLSDCEDVDSGEDVIFQISTNGGTSWTNLQTISYLTIGVKSYTVNIPASAAQSSAKIRWYQISNSGSGYDTWYIDNIDVAVVANVVNGSPYSYLWSPANAFELIGSGDTVTTNPITTAKSFSVVVTDTLSNCIKALSKIITISNTSLNVNIVSDSSVCVGGDVQLTAYVNGNTSDHAKYNYLWSPSTSMNSDTIYNPLVSNIQTQSNYVVSVSDKLSNCSGAALTIVSPQGSATKPTISQVSNFLLCNEYSSSIQWFLDGKAIPNATAQLFNLATTNYAAGCYTVKYYGTSCTTTSDCYILVVTGIEDEVSTSDLFNLNIYPNPVSKILNVEFAESDLVQEDFSIGFYTLDGTEITSDVLFLNSDSNNKMTIDIESLNSGTYIIKMFVNSTEVIKSFVKE